MNAPLAEILPSEFYHGGTVASVEELQALLHQMAKECLRPVIATVVRADGDMLSIGLGRPISFLTYIPKDDKPPYLSVLGADRTGGEVCFDFNSEPTFFSKRNTVPFEIGLEVMRQFVLSAGLPLPDIVVWEPT